MKSYIFLITVIAVLLIAVTFVTIHGVDLTNEQYDRLKAIVLRWSGIVTFLGVLVSTFKFDYGEETITVVAALGAFMAYMLGLSNKNFIDGATAGEGGDVDESDYI